MRTTRKALALGVAVATLAAACGRGAGGGSGDVDTALLTRPGGDVMLAGGGKLAYEITSDRYRQWAAARQALRAQRLGLTMRLDPLRVTEADIQRVVRYFERNGKARRAIEGAGMSVRDYVLTTIALEQQMAVASGRWVERERPSVPAAPVVPSESIAAELARDSALVRDTAVRSDTAPRRDTVRRRVDTVRAVDTVVVPRRDTTRRPDTTASPSPGQTTP